MIRVLIADDHAVVREGVRRILEREPDFEILAEAATGHEAIALAESTRPDVAILDLAMPGPSGIQVTARLRRTLPDCRVLILSMHDDADQAIESVRVGAHGYVLKDAAPTELCEAVRRVHTGTTCYSPAIADKLNRSVQAEPTHTEQRDGFSSLTGRERLVLVGIARGLTNKDIAMELGISHRTVETYRESLMRKLRIHSVAGLTRFALQMGLIAGD